MKPNQIERGMSEQKVKNRWLIALCGVGIHISIGSVYAYSVITQPGMAVFGVEEGTLKWAFKLAIFMLGVSAALFGKWVEKVGPRKSGTASGLFYGLGMLGSGLAFQIQSLPLFIISYGVIAGFGLGLGYITPVSTLIKWFPDRRGMATGMAIMGFGFASLIFGPVMQALFDKVGVAYALYILGAVYLVLILGLASYMEKPVEGYLPQGFVPGESKLVKADIADLDAREAIKTHRFYYIWTMMFINITCGIGIIAAASPMVQQQIGYSPMQAATIVGLIGIFNGAGRFLWSSLSDYLGRANTYIVFFTFQIVAYYFLPEIKEAFLFIAVLLMVMTMYGGGFSMLPAFLGDIFGTKQVGAIHGRVLTAWSMAGVAGPSLYDYVKEVTGSLTATLHVFSAMFVIALIISLLMKYSTVKLSRSLSQPA